MIVLRYHEMVCIGFHAEGSALVSLFALLFWDVIYSPGIPDAFRSPHQICPLDLRCTEFYNNRRPMIDHHINFLENGGTEVS